MIYSAGSDWVTRELSPGHTPCPLHGLSRGETISLEISSPSAVIRGDMVGRCQRTAQDAVPQGYMSSGGVIVHDKRFS